MNTFGIQKHHLASNAAIGAIHTSRTTRVRVGNLALKDFQMQCYSAVSAMLVERGCGAFVAPLGKTTILAAIVQEQLRGHQVVYVTRQDFAMPIEGAVAALSGNLPLGVRTMNQMAPIDWDRARAGSILVASEAQLVGGKTQRHARMIEGEQLGFFDWVRSDVPLAFVFDDIKSYAGKLRALIEQCSAIRGSEPVVVEASSDKPLIVNDAMLRERSPEVGGYRVSKITGNLEQIERMVERAASAATLGTDEMDFFTSMVSGALAGDDWLLVQLGLTKTVAFAGHGDAPPASFYDTTLAALGVPTTIAQLAEHGEDFEGSEDGGHHLWWALVWSAASARMKKLGAPSDQIMTITDPLYRQHLAVANRVIARGASAAV